MSNRRFMTSIMCDDVRREAGNKLSYMGIYMGSLLVPAFPFTLPKLCFVLSVMAPGEDPPPQSLEFRLIRNDEIIGEMRLEESAIKAPYASNHGALNERRLTIGTVLQLFPFQLAEPCILRTRAFWDGEELKGGSWPVELMQSGS